MSRDGQDKNNKRIKEIEKRLEELPKGTLTYKTINDKKQPYLQRTIDGKTVSYYIKQGERDAIFLELEERRALQEELELLRKYSLKIAEIYMRQPRMAIKYGIGHQNFEDFYNENRMYIDKTEFIKEWWEASETITLITRPRRFGKTLMLSMVEHFFSTQYAGSGAMFDGLSIWRHSEYRKLQGTYPVIFITFAAVKGNSYEQAMSIMPIFFRRIYDDYSYMGEESSKLDEKQKQLYREYYKKLSENDISCLDNALAVLCELIYAYHRTNPILLIDEYDTPMQEGYTYGYWDEMTNFMRTFINKTLKTNRYMGKTLITGITRVAKESLFSDMNNLAVYSVTSSKYAKYFGFTELEVQDILTFADCDEMKKVKEAYDGFTFGNIKNMYNPWSVLCYASERELRPYWNDTGGVKMISKLLARTSIEIKRDFETLLQGGSIHKTINENVTFSELEKDREMIWPLLLCAGYLKADNISFDMYTECDLSITNKETRVTFYQLVQRWFDSSSVEYNDFCKYLLAGDVELMEEFINYISVEMFSFFDVGRRPSEKAPERFYHGFVLGLIAALKDKYAITSNRESGRGRYDIMLLPLSDEYDGIIIEFKVMDEKREDSLEDTAKNALLQIEEKNYAQELISKGIGAERIRKYGFAFCGKEVKIM